MKVTSIVRFACVVAVVASALIVGYATTIAAQKSPDESAASDAAKAPVVRLPNYYGKVSTEEQRPQLRAIVKEFAPKIQQKQEELQALIAERDAELDKVLTPEQRDEIAKLRAAAAAGRDVGDDASDSAKSKAKKAKSKAKKAA